jgi:quinol monooxygenase YgiN
MSKPYVVIAILDAKPGKENELAEALKTVVSPSRAETTCLEYRLHQSIDNPSQFIFYEIWVSKEKHAEQFNKPYIIELGKKLEPLLGKSYQVHFANELDV